MCCDGEQRPRARVCVCVRVCSIFNELNPLEICLCFSIPSPFVGGRKAGNRSPCFCGKISQMPQHLVTFFIYNSLETYWWLFVFWVWGRCRLGSFARTALSRIHLHRNMIFLSRGWSLQHALVYVCLMCRVCMCVSCTVCVCMSVISWLGAFSASTLNLYLFQLAYFVNVLPKKVLWCLCSCFMSAITYNNTRFRFFT